MKLPEKSSERSPCCTICSGRMMQSIPQVDVQLAPAFPADGKAGSVQTHWIWRERDVPYIIENSEIIADKVNHGQVLYTGDINVAYLFCIHYSCALPANIGLFTELLV